MSKSRLLAAAVGATFFLGTGLAYANIDTQGLNSVTGPFSDNSSVLDTAKEFNFTLDNLLSLTRVEDATVDTGRNVVDNNTTVSGLLTGTVDVAFMHDNNLSSITPVMLPLFNTGNEVNVDGRNLLTGPNSLNLNEVNTSSALSVDLSNNIRSTDNTSLDLNTGGNVADSNTTVGGVMTGNIAGRVQTQNLGTRMFDTLSLSNLGLGDQNGVSVRFGNGTTGPNSINENILTNSVSTTIEVQNDATIDNQMDVVANTGNNVVSTNTTVGPVRTGSVRIDLNSTTNPF